MDSQSSLGVHGKVGPMSKIVVQTMGTTVTFSDNGNIESPDPMVEDQAKLFQMLMKERYLYLPDEDSAVGTRFAEEYGGEIILSEYDEEYVEGRVY